MAKKKKPKTPRPRPAPRPGYRIALPWLLLLATGVGCSGSPPPGPPPVQQAKAVEGDIDGDGFVDEVLEASDKGIVWRSGDRVRVATAPDPSRVEDATYEERMDETPSVRTEVDLDGDAHPDTWIYADRVTASCIPWGSGCTTAGCCAPFSCMWTGVGINKKKKCCGGTSGSPFFNCQ